MNSTNMIPNAPSSATAKPVLLEAKLADPDRLCCFVQNPNPCAAVQELFKTAGISDPAFRKLSAALLAGDDLKAELVTDLKLKAVLLVLLQLVNQQIVQTDLLIHIKLMSQQQTDLFLQVHILNLYINWKVEMYSLLLKVHQKQNNLL